MMVGIGCDVVEIARLEKLTHRDQFVSRVLTSEEHAIYRALNSRRQCQWLAGRYAAKEAIAKALGTGIGANFSFQDVSILPNEHGAPIAILHQRRESHPLLPFRLMVSISHDGGVAMGIAMLERQE